jgi:4-amino-4-deoxy-L-arabinose transferase-like glycosyltransferase
VSPRATRVDLAGLLVAAAVLFGAALGTHDLWNPNEPIYGEAVKEMLARGSFGVPYVNGIPFGEKPILYYWLALAASKLLGGVSEATLRMPSVVAGLAIVAGSYLLVLPYAGRARALATAIACLTTYQVWWVSRTVQMDVLVAAATLWVILPLSRVLDFGLPPLQGWLIAGAVAGLGFLAKGPVAWICPGLVIVAYAAWSRRLAALFSPAAGAGALMALAVAAPWYLFLAASGQAGVLREVLIRQNFQRFTNPWDHAAPFWYYAPYVFVDMAPYAFFALLAWKLPRPHEPDRRLARLATVWIVAIVGFFSLSKSKRDPYIVPIAPAIACLAAEVAVAFASDRVSRIRACAVVGVASAWGALLVVAATVLAVREIPRHPEAARAGWWLAATLAAGGAAVVAAGLGPRRRWLLPRVLPAAAAGTYLVVAASTLPALDAFKSARPVSGRIAELAGDSGLVASYNFWQWRAEYRFYLQRPIDNLLGPAALRAAWDRPERLVVLVDRASLAGARQVIGDREPAFSRDVGSQTIYLFTNH